MEEANRAKQQLIGTMLNGRTLRIHYGRVRIQRRTWSQSFAVVMTAVPLLLKVCYHSLLFTNSCVQDDTPSHRRDDSGMGGGKHALCRESFVLAVSCNLDGL